MYRIGIVKSCSISTWQIKSSFFLFVINSGFLCIAVLYISGEKPLKIYAFVQNIHIARTLLNWLFKRHYPIMYSFLGLNVSNSPQTLHKKWILPLRISSVKISRKLRIWSYLLKKSLIENFILCAVKVWNSTNVFKPMFSMLC